MAYTIKLDQLLNEITETAKADKASAIIAVGRNGEAHIDYVGDQLDVLIFSYRVLKSIADDTGKPFKSVLKFLKKIEKLDESGAMSVTTERAE